MIYGIIRQEKVEVTVDELLVVLCSLGNALSFVVRVQGSKIFIMVYVYVFNSCVRVDKANL